MALELLATLGSGQYNSTKAATDVQDEDGNTPLHIAIVENNEVLYELLLEAGPAKTAENKFRRFAHLPRGVECCELLVDAGCDKNVKNSDGDTPLHLATRASNTELCTLLLESGCATSVKWRAKDLPAPPRGSRWKRVMAASAGGVPEQLEQVRVAQVTHPAASSSAHEVPDNHHGARRAAGPCEVEWRRAWSSSATSPSRLGQSVLSVLHPRQFEGRCFAVRHPDPKCAHASAAPAASCARVSITHVVACLRPPACVAVGRGTPKHLHGCATSVKNNRGDTPLHRAIPSHDLTRCKFMHHSRKTRDFKALNLAMFHSRVEHCKLLLMSGCEEAALNNQGCTPFHLAMRASWPNRDEKALWFSEVTTARSSLIWRVALLNDSGARAGAGTRGTGRTSGSFDERPGRASGRANWWGDGEKGRTRSQVRDSHALNVSVKARNVGYVQRDLSPLTHFPEE